MSTTQQLNKSLIVFIILIAAIALRLTHIDADTPDGVSWSAGVYVDEGYKTLSPRNLILFGNTHWHEADTYGGWMEGSPVTQWSVYAAFKSFSVDISSARIVPIIYFSLFILLYIYFFKDRFNPKLFYLGLLLMVTDITIFTFSRVALFEIPMSFFVYGLILPITLHYEKKEASTLPIIWLFIGSLAVAYTVKLSGLIYFAPALAAASIFLITNNHKINKKQAIVYSAIIFIMILLVLAITYKHWGRRIDINPQSFIYSIIEHRLIQTSPFLLIAATLCAGHIIAFQAKHYFNNLYRFTLLSMVVTSLVILSLFQYSPLRYFVPFIPAYILLITEWLHTTSIDKKIGKPNLFATSISIALFSLATLYGFITAELHELIHVRYLIIISFFTILCIWYFRKKILTFHRIKKVLIGLVIISFASNLYFIGSFIYNPTYNANDIRQQLAKIAKNKVVAGGWAPFFTLGTPIKTLYSGMVYNPPEALKIIKPDYYLLSESQNILIAFERLREDPDIHVGTAIELGKYNNTRVALYPLTYN